jgi:hypothetical protein
LGSTFPQSITLLLFGKTESEKVTRKNKKKRMAKNIQIIWLREPILSNLASKVLAFIYKNNIKSNIKKGIY